MTVLSLGSIPGASASDYVVGWDTVELIEFDDAQTSDDSRIATDADGNAIAAWYREDGSTFSIFYNRYEQGRGWLGEAELDGTDQICYTVAVDCNDDGVALVAWAEYDEDRSEFDIAGRFYYPGIGWGDVESISVEPTGNHADPEVALDSDGNAVVVWTQYDGLLYNVYGRAYEQGVGWESEELLDMSLTENARRPKVGVDGLGTAIVVWAQGSGVTSSIWSVRHDFAAGWGTPASIATGAHEAAPLLSVARDGNATCAWNHFNTGTVRHEVYAANYVLGAGWGARTPLYVSASYSAYASGVGVDHDGNAVVLTEYWGLSSIRILEMKYDSDTGWSPYAAPLAPLSDFDLFAPRVSMNDEGKALILFGMQDSTTQMEVWGATYDLVSGWQTPVLVGPDTLSSSYDWGVSMSESGNGVGVILQRSAIGACCDVWAIIYNAPDETAPYVSVDAPLDGTIVDQATVTVSGTTEPGATVEVNGLLVAVDDDGAFSIEVSLFEGENEIVATATDAAGNSASESVSVTYDNPLVEAVEDLQDELDAAQIDLDEANEQLADLVEELNDTETAFSDAADAMQGSLEDLLDRLEEMASELNDTQGTLTESQDELGDANDRMDALVGQMTLLAAIMGMLAILVVALFVMHLRARKGHGGSGRDVSSEESPPPPE